MDPSCGHPQGHLPWEEECLRSAITQKNKLLALLCSRDWGKLYSNCKAASSKNKNWYFLEKKYFSPYIHHTDLHAFQNTVLCVQLQICLLLKYFSLSGVLEGNGMDFTFSKGSTHPISCNICVFQRSDLKKLTVQIIYNVKTRLEIRKFYSLFKSMEV